MELVCDRVLKAEFLKLVVLKVQIRVYPVLDDLWVHLTFGCRIRGSIVGIVILCGTDGRTRGEFRPRQTRQLPRAADLKGRLLSCQSY